MRRGIFGGSFDPIHNCHLFIAKEVLKILKLDMIFFIPVGVAPHKKDKIIATPLERLKLVKLALNDYPEFELLDWEVRDKEVTYAVDTVEKLVTSTKYDADDEWFYIMGIDSFLDIVTWKEPEKLLSLCNFAVLPRKGYTPDMKDIPYMGGFKNALLANIKAGSSLAFEMKNGSNINFIGSRECDTSSTAIRQSLLVGNLPENSLPQDVESYIIKKMTYDKNNLDTGLQSDKTINSSIRAILEKKGENCLIINVEKLTSFTSAFIVCSAASDRQVKAIAENIITTLKHEGAYVLGRDGMEGNGSGWVILDYGEFFVHIFKTELREYYSLEKCWEKAEFLYVDEFIEEDKTIGFKLVTEKEDTV